MTSNTMETNSPSPETLRQTREFNAVNKLFIDASSFRGFQQNPCRKRIPSQQDSPLFTAGGCGEISSQPLKRQHGFVYKKKKNGDTC